MNRFINSFFNTNSDKDPLSFLKEYQDIKLHRSLETIDKEQWNKLIGENNPFIEYEFLRGLEVSKSVGRQSGWNIYYLTMYKDKTLIGAVPMYLKYNSYGEYIFDWSWASAYSQSGLDYYPKLTIAVPFTPATGKRLLVHPDFNFEEIADKLVKLILELSEALRVSSVHWLFVEKNEMEYLAKKGFMPRYTHQYHWKNNNYNTFDDFLQEFNSKKRNQLKRERRQAQEGLKIETIIGKDLKPEHWKAMYSLYLSTTDKKWGQGYLTEEFFDYMRDNFSDKAIMVLAEKNGEYIAGALNFRKGDHLYGRYWGALEEQQCLHFEICYYQSIDYAIKEKITLFEAGAQGEHKFYRGFLPEYTYSSHWIAQPDFSVAIKDYLKKEKRSLDTLLIHYKENSPFKNNEKASL